MTLISKQIINTFNIIFSFEDTNKNSIYNDNSNNNGKLDDNSDDNSISNVFEGRKLKLDYRRKLLMTKLFNKKGLYLM